MGERLRSIPPNIRGRVTVRIGIGGGGIGSSRRATRETWRDGEEDWEKVVDEKETRRKPTREKPAIRAGLYENEEKIRLEAEVMENYNVQQDLGIILQFRGIDSTRAFFMRGKRYYGPNTTLFYSPTIYNKERVLLLLATHGYIVEVQVVPKQKDVNPLFQEEIYLPQLTETYDPQSMTVNQRNNLVIVSYKLR